MVSLVNCIFQLLVHTLLLKGYQQVNKTPYWAIVSHTICGGLAGTVSEVLFRGTDKSNDLFWSGFTFIGFWQSGGWKLFPYLMIKNTLVNGIVSIHLVSIISHNTCKTKHGSLVFYNTNNLKIHVGCLNWKNKRFAQTMG